MIVLCVLFMSGHVASFLFKCVWFYKPGYGSCQNHRPIISKEKDIVELTVYKPVNVENKSKNTEVVLAPQDPQTSTKNYMQSGKVIVDSNVREGPGMGYPIKSSLLQGVEVEILETKDGWFKIKRLDIKSDEEEFIGWVWRDLVDEE